jgi:DnaA-homolog protein
MKGQQLPLAVQLRETASFDSFFSGPNSEALAALRNLGADLLLYGPAGAGKTHLLQACARATGAAYLPLREFREFGADVLQGFADSSALCLDDIDAVADDEGWCIALLRLLDRQRARRLRCVIAARRPPDRMALTLPDLRTRLSATATYGLRPLDDSARAQFLQQRAQARGLQLPDEVSQWLLTRLPRDLPTLLAVLDQLDRVSLTRQRRLTLPLVQQTVLPMLQPPSVPGDADAQTGSAH